MILERKRRERAWAERAKPRSAQARSLFTLAHLGGNRVIHRCRRAPSGFSRREAVMVTRPLGKDSIVITVADAVDDLRRAKQRLRSFLLCQGYHYHGTADWSEKHPRPRRRHSGLLGGTGRLARLPRNPSDGWAAGAREASRTVLRCAPTDRSRPRWWTHCLRRSSASRGSIRIPWTSAR